MNRHQVTRGLRVRVVCAAPSYSSGWNNSWIEEMDPAVWRVFTVDRVSDSGVYFTEEGSDYHGYCGYPWSVLEPVVQTVDTPHLMDSGTAGPRAREAAQIRDSHRTLVIPGEYGSTRVLSPDALSPLWMWRQANVIAHEERQNRLYVWTERRGQFKRRMARQMKGTPRSWRYSDVSYKSYAETHKASGKALAKHLAQIKRLGRAAFTDNGFELSFEHFHLEGRLLARDIAFTLNRLREWSEGVASAAYSRLCRETTRRGFDFGEVVNACSDCCRYEAVCDMSKTLPWGTLICSRCIEAGYRWGARQSRYIHSDYAIRFFSSLTSFRHDTEDGYITAQYGSDHCYRWRGVYVTYDLYLQLREDEARGARSSRSSGDTGELSNYHGAYRDFTERVTGDYPALGVELEVYCTKRKQAVIATRALPDGFICERDGSLHDAYGFEIVTRPYGKPEWAEVAPRLLATLTQHKVVGYDTDGQYGIHVTVHRRHLRPLAEARILLLLSSYENRGFVQAIAQREAIYGGSTLNIGNVRKPAQNTQSLGGTTEVFVGYDKAGYEKYTKKIRGIGKYATVNLKGELAEFRIFQSTTYLPSFMKNLEFVWALIEWANAPTGTSWRHEDFVRWLAARPNVRKDFPHLLEYLRRESYRIKGGTRVNNTWLPALTSSLLVRCSTQLEFVDEVTAEAQQTFPAPETTPVEKPKRVVSEATRIKLREAALRRRRDEMGLFIAA